MDTKTNKRMDEVRDELEQLAGEIKVKIHLANMDAKTTWNDTLAPRFLEARAHAKQAGEAYRRSLEETVEALRAFIRTL